MLELSARYGRCENLGGKCESCKRNLSLSGKCETYTGGMRAMKEV